MTEQTLFRLALILQSQAPSTLDKYICKLAQAVLIERHDGLSLNNLCEEIQSQFNLSFSTDEIRTAITKKGKKELTVSDGSYILTESARQKLLKEIPLSEKLNSIIEKYIQTILDKAPVEDISKLILKYIYHCFNSNVNNLLSLFNHREISTAVQEVQDIDFSNEEISIINGFISWENAEKDSLIYDIVSICYEYCMLTIKNDTILSKELFSGKRFFLDANIIFRMAGINNEERQTVTKSFVAHCKSAGIKLYCTSETLDEVYKVIAAQTGFIQSIAGNDQPISSSVLKSMNPSLEINDFYKLYCDWCDKPYNQCGDYTTFNRYLLDLVQATLSQLQVQQSSAYRLEKDANQYNRYVEDLISFKSEKRKWRAFSRSSAETDVTNILDVIKLRTRNNDSIWRTNDFIVSADQLLIAWANQNFSGVPLVVLPSVWLSIILRYTGRTEDDYKSFCLFLTQRQHASTEGIIDPIRLLKIVNSKTSSTELKEKILNELTQDKTRYSFIAEEDYESNIDLAFDNVLKDFGETNQQKMIDLRNEMAEKMAIKESESKRYADEQANINEEVGKEKAAMILAKERAHKKVAKYRRISKPKWLYYIIVAVFLLSGLIIWFREIEPLYGWILSALPAKLINSSGWFSAVWTIVSVAFGFLCKGINMLFSYLGSLEREQHLYKKYFGHNINTISKE